jgi:hypothetical protein
LVHRLQDRMQRYARVAASTTFFALMLPAAASADLYVAAGASAGNPCTVAVPCGSFERAYTLAAPGEVVHIAGGSYGGQDIDAVQKPGPAVVFQPAPGASVTVHNIDIDSGTHIEFRNLTVTESTYNRQGAQWITYRHVKMRQFFIRGSDHIRYIDSEVGPNTNDDGMNFISAAYQTSDGASDVVFDGVAIHDFKKWNSGAHVDCLAADDVDGLVIRNSRFWNCEHFSILLGEDLWSHRMARNVVIENNFLDCCISGYYSIGIGGVEGNTTIRHNSTNKNFGFLGGPVSGVTISSNIMPSNQGANCDKADYRFNVIGSGNRCGPGDKVAPNGFRDAAALDFHLRPGAAAIDAGDPQSGAGTDIDGESRAGNTPDAGADEANAVAAPDRGATGGGSESLRQATVRARRVKLGKLRKRGIRVQVACPAACRVSAALVISKRRARALKVPRTIARASRKSAGTLRLKVSRKTARRLSRVKKLQVTLVVNLRNASGHRTVRKRLRLVR